MPDGRTDQLIKNLYGLRKLENGNLLVLDERVDVTDFKRMQNELEAKRKYLETMEDNV